MTPTKRLQELERRVTKIEKEKMIMEKSIKSLKQEVEKLKKIDAQSKFESFSQNQKEMQPLIMKRSEKSEKELKSKEFIKLQFSDIFADPLSLKISEGGKRIERSAFGNEFPTVCLNKLFEEGIHKFHFKYHRLKGTPNWLFIGICTKQACCLIGKNKWIGYQNDEKESFSISSQKLGNFYENKEIEYKFAKKEKKGSFPHLEDGDEFTITLDFSSPLGVKIGYNFYRNKEIFCKNEFDTRIGIDPRTSTQKPIMIGVTFPAFPGQCIELVAKETFFQSPKKIRKNEIFSSDYVKL